MKVIFKKVTLIKAEKKNVNHKKGIFDIFNQNIEFFNLTSSFISIKDHSIWWENIFTKEYVYIITYSSEICGYIRLTKERTENKEKNEISIALSKKYQKLGIGTYAFNLFEEEMKKKKIKKIVAKTIYENKRSQNFFEKNNFQPSTVRYIKRI